MNQKIAPRIERKRDSIEFERSENIGQFLICPFFYIFNILKAFMYSVSIAIRMFQSLSMRD